MKKRFFLRIVAMLLCMCMVSTTVQAAPKRGKSATNKNQSNHFFKETQEKTDEKTDSEVSVVEDETTVENSDMLRATTYALDSTDNGVSVASDTDSSSSTVLKYFPVTMYDYDTDTINNATSALESKPIGQGIYFSNGTPTDSNDLTVSFSSFEEGTYYIQSCRANENGASSWLSYDQGTIVGKDKDDATKWTLDIENDVYYLSCTVDGKKYYMLFNGEGTSRFTTTKTVVTLSTFSGYADGVMLSQGSYYLNHYGGGNKTDFKGYSGSDAGNVMYMYLVTDNDAEGTLITPTYDATAIYAAWNYWNKKSGSDANGDLFYTGLVEAELDENKDVVFTKTEGGIFDSDTTVKDIYTNVEMPFVYSEKSYEGKDAEGNSKTYTSNYYTFDASKNGVYFHEDSDQGSSKTAGSNTRLYFDEGTPQAQSNGKYGDGSTTVWAPYNDGTGFTQSQTNYHFGMRATIPFTMTSNGRMNENDDDSAPITFTFSGDDDVWVFIDGQLVIDLGGIHNRLNATIDFAANTVTYYEDNDADDNTETGSYNDSSFETTQELFGNNISQDRATFAATDTHELTIFYLERGEGSSNCQIEFNLPMKDTLTITKHADNSWTSNGTTDGVVTSLTTAEKEKIDNIDFGFTLYKKDTDNTYDPVANTKYKVLDKDGQVIGTRTTDKKGHFTLKNGQSARFVTTFLDKESGGTTYYVVEDDVSASGFVTPDYNFKGEAADGFYVGELNAEENDGTYDSASSIPEQIVDLEAEKNKSYEITVYGSEEAEDSLAFICENYLDASLPNPSARPTKDEIVIDYGLGVEIDVLANDVYRGEGIKLQEITSNGRYGTATITEDQTIQYQLTEQLTGVEVLTYKVKVTGNTADSCEYATANVYIYPATVMYYEENFSNFVTYTDGKSGGWSIAGNSETDNQEPGVVGTESDSPYGSDVAYLNDSGDSNGSSMYVKTEKGAAQFSYTFTGTGTSFYGRTTENSGYMRVVVKDSTGKTIQGEYIDTVYLNETMDGNNEKVNIDRLYNIPVFTTDELDYGTYSVTVTIAKGTTSNGFGTDFWLDGIRVYQPLDSTDLNYIEALSAYATDGEANMTNVTLRNKLIREADYDDAGNLTYSNGNFVFFTDNDGTVDTVEQYTNDGPKEELYLYSGQTITFSLSDWDANTNKLHIGLKAPSGSAKVKVGTTDIELNNSVDCYYEVSSLASISTDESGKKIATFTITAGEDTLVSVTNMKVVGGAKFTIIEDTDVQVSGAEGDGIDTVATIQVE